jgi:hypothetical protein
VSRGSFDAGTEADAPSTHVPAGGRAAGDGARAAVVRRWTAACLVAILVASAVSALAGAVLDLGAADVALVWPGLFVIGLIADPLHAFSAKY